MLAYFLYLPKLIAIEIENSMISEQDNGQFSPEDRISPAE